MNLEEYEARYAEQYRKGSFETTLVAARRRIVISSLERHRHRRVLEVGCGMEPLFVSAPDFESFVVVEPSPRFAEQARALAGNRPAVTVLGGYLEDELAEAKCRAPFDFIVVSSLLHEVSDPTRLLGAVHELCDESTLVHVNVPNVHSFHRLLAREAGLIDDVFEQSAMEKHFGRQTRFDHATLVEMMHANGFDVIEHGSYFIKPFTHAQMDAIIAAGILPPEAIAGLEGMIRHAPNLGAEIYVNSRARHAQGES